MHEEPKLEHLRHFTDMPVYSAADTSIRRLHDFTCRMTLGRPTYHETHDGKIWSSLVQVDDTTYGHGRGSTIHSAKEGAAWAALISFGQSVPDDGGLLVERYSPADTAMRRLHDYSRCQHVGMPVYGVTLIKMDGQSIWSSLVQVDDITRGRGHGSSRKSAEERAACAALISLGLSVPYGGTVMNLGTHDNSVDYQQRPVGDQDAKVATTDDVKSASAGGLQSLDAYAFTRSHDDSDHANPVDRVSSGYSSTSAGSQASVAKGGLFAVQMTQCQLNEVRGHQFINQCHHHCGSALTWAQLLIMTSPSALIAGHEGYLYLSKLHRYLGGDENSVIRAKLVDSLTMRHSYSQQVRDFTGLVNILVLCFVLFRKFIVRAAV